VSPLSKPVFNNPEFVDTDWMVGARCRDMPYEEAVVMFFPEKGHNSRDARAICLGQPATDHHAAMSPCPVKTQCLKYALSFEPEGVVGIWAGTSPNERHKMDRSRKASESPTGHQVRSYRNLDRLGELLGLVSSVNRGTDNVDA